MAKAHPNAFEILGVTLSSSPSEVVRAYRKASLNAHPDRGGTDHTFHMVTWAYDIIRNPEWKIGHAELLRPFNIGEAVEIAGLAARQTLNGSLGTVRAWNGRRVQVEVGGVCVLVRPSVLSRLASQPETHQSERHHASASSSA